MPVAARCIRLAKGLRSSIADFLQGPINSLEDVTNIGRQLFSRSIDFIRRQGPVGDEIAGQVEEAVRRAQRRAAIQKQEIGDVLKGVSKADRIEIGRFLSGRRPRLPDELRGKAETLREILDRDLEAAQFFGFKRTLKNGKKVPIEGSGNPFPQRPNARGKKILDLAHSRGAASGRVKATLERMVEEGRYPDEDAALAALREFRDGQMRATNGYLERQRVELPEEFVEFDPAAVLDGVVEKNAYTLEGARLWGQNFDGLNALLGKLELEAGKSQARIVEDHLKTGFGVQSAVPKYHQRIAGALSNWETNSKLSGLFSPLLNFGQRFTATADAPILVQIRALAELPPGVAPWFRNARRIRRSIEQSGAVTGRNPLLELSKQSRIGEAVSRTILAPFFSVARGNEFHSAYVARLSIEHDINQLIRLQGRESTIGRMWDSLRTLSVDPEGAVSRRIERAGLDPQQAAELVASGERLSPAQFAEVMQRAVENDQFALNLLTTPIWWQNSPWLRLAFKFKTFGVRQTQFLYERIAKEAMLGNVAPMVKFVAITTLLGEGYHIARDLVEGKDRSALLNALNQDPEKRDTEAIAARLAGDFVAQGGAGLLADLSWGIEGWVFGPAGSSLANVRDMVAHVNQDPRQTGLAIQELLKREIVPLRQSQGLLRQAEEKIRGQTDRFISYHQVRQAGFEFKDNLETDSPSERMTAAIDRALTGTPRFPTTPRSLRYRYAADAITAQDVDEAAEYLTGIFSLGTTPKEIDRLARGAEGSMRSRAPLGNLNEAERDQFLRTMPPSRRQEVRRLRREWIRDYEKAIARARRQARRALREEQR